MNQLLLRVEQHSGARLKTFGNHAVTQGVVREIGVEVGERVDWPAQLPEPTALNNAVASQGRIRHVALRVDVGGFDDMSHDHGFALHTYTMK
jgi:hypothetical protein